MHIAAVVYPIIMMIYLSYKAQVVLLIRIEISTKYFKFSDVFYSNSMTELT